MNIVFSQSIKIFLDQVDLEETKDDCVKTFVKMFYNSGFTDGLFTNGISYEAFRNGYYFNCFDLSTSNRSGLANVVPAVRVGLY